MTSETPSRAWQDDDAAARIRQLDRVIQRQRRIVEELERDRHGVVWAKSMLRALERARAELSDRPARAGRMERGFAEPEQRADANRVEGA